MSQKVSVIIPVYNAGKYITRCIESLLNQTLQECEFIFINDGSIDDSREIIEGYKQVDDRIILINQVNQGVSIARNKGLHLAAGEYVGFVDADDCIEKDMYETLYNSVKQSNCDVVISNFKGETEGHKVITTYPFPIDIVLEKDYIEQEVLPYFLKADNLNTVVNKIYRNNLIKENNVKFPSGIALGEDGMFNVAFFSGATRMKYVDYVGYHYKEVAGSATRNISEKDYFQRAVEVYTMELPQIYTDKIDRVRISKLRSIKFINSVMSYIHVYFTPSKDVSFNKRYKYVKSMIRNEHMREALPIYYSEIYNKLGRYERLIINLIKRQSTVGLYCVTAYSRFRNK
ncbi:glycosyl transferase family 2 [Bacillus pseudomycoides]|uniref:glycosyltransferase n=1 Tax=Bacillus pseudomycoides TaxID=64104 RepID=UPI000BF980FC|nr:glycosyltransferase [Bacillus pseudomycoides]PGE95497.1 glycosyl transferase family 2 [Bacillus pseudomycoides]PHE40178.1 glycosyl transferase family 2 [Bacillus pseudomycoides]